MMNLLAMNLPYNELVIKRLYHMMKLAYNEFIIIAQLTGAVEYTNCFCAEGVRPSR